MEEWKNRVISSDKEVCGSVISLNKKSVWVNAKEYLYKP